MQTNDDNSCQSGLNVTFYRAEKEIFVQPEDIYFYKEIIIFFLNKCIINVISLTDILRWISHLLFP